MRPEEKWARKSSKIILWTMGVVSVVTAVVLTLLLYSPEKEVFTHDRYLIPEGYRGAVTVFYNVEGFPEVKKEGKYDVLPIGQDGVFLTRTNDPDYGTVVDEYYYIKDDGRRTKISDACISSMVTGSYSKGLTDSKKDVRYVSFFLDKEPCRGEETDEPQADIPTLLQERLKEKPLKE